MTAWHELAGAAPAMDPPTVLHGRRAADLLVVGLGASGLEATVAAARAGADVVGLDAVGVAAGAAGANGGFLLAGLARFHHDAVARYGRGVAVGWYRRTQDELDRLATLEPTFRRVGSVRTCASAEERADVAAQLAALRADGIAAEPYADDLGEGLLVHGDGVVQPVARCHRLAREALAAGSTLVVPAVVTDVLPGRVRVAGRAVGAATAGPPGTRPGRAADGGGFDVRARRVLVAVDGALERLVPGVGVRTVRLQMRASAPQHRVLPDHPRYHRWGYDYAQQLPDGRVLMGGGRDVGGDAEEDAAAEPSGPVQAHLDAWAATLGVTAPVTARWAARVGYTPDRLPVDRRLAPTLHAVGGYSGHGNVLGGLLARQAALDLLGAPADVGP